MTRLLRVSSRYWRVASSRARRAVGGRDGVPNRIRTGVTAVKGRCPRPLHDGDLKTLTTAGGRFGGGKRDRTADLLHAMQALSQLSYTPTQGRALYHAGRRSRSRASTRFLPATASVGPSSGVLVRPKTIRRSGIAIFGKGKPY